jgi:hypothetical protein
MLKYILLSITAGGLLSACHKSLSRGDADFGVYAEQTTVPVGDTVKFRFTGSPDVLTFYSGEPGRRYEFRNRTSADGIPLLRFRTIRANGSQPNSLSLLVSNNFNGVIVSDTPTTINRIKEAAWTDITQKAVLSTGAVGAVASGNIDLSEFSAQGKPVYIAFKYQALAGSIQPKWTIDSFTVKNVLADGTTYVNANMNAFNIAYSNYGVPTFSPGFFACKVTNTYNWSISSTTLVITGATSAAAATAPAEAWVMIGPIDLKKVTPDMGVPVKNVSQSTVDLFYNHIYTAAGAYHAVFSGGKISAADNAYTTTSFQITVK